MSWLRLVRLIRGTGAVAEAAPTCPSRCRVVPKRGGQRPDQAC